ncbi:MAG: TIGR00725 family protein, partial [Dehalococcoidia bacterium]|nr:TIGR00725 family protein [Dehalococcoidia bacterium]
MLFIGVIGDGDCSPAVAEVAAEVGRLLAGRGAAVVCGGLGGVMEAACRGAKSAGGLTIGILPSDNRRHANRYVDIPIVTGLGEARNVLVVKSAQAVIAIGGMYGTLSEVAIALKNGIPVVGLNTWRLQRQERWDEGIAVVRT